MKLAMSSSLVLGLCMALAVWPAVAGEADVHNIPLHSPLLAAECQQAQTDYEDGVAALQAKDYVAAENDFGNSLANASSRQGFGPRGQAYLGLAEALAGQGRNAEALQTYATLFNPGPHVSYGGSYFTRANLEYALLLSRTGHWGEAIAHYNDALPDLANWDYKAKVQFDPDTPQPVVLAAAAHIGLGLYDNFEGQPDGNTRAFQEYVAALRLAPNWDQANYYYGYGWQQLSPTDKAKLGSAQQAKAALLKAVKIGKGNIKKAAQKALMVAMNPKVNPSVTAK